MAVKPLFLEKIEMHNTGHEPPSRGETLADQVHRQLCAAILAGSHAPGERITIRRLADELNVSATPVREAVLRLISDDVLQVTDRNAIVVPTLAKGEIQEIFEIRRNLEGSLSARAAPLLDKEDLDFLEKTQEIFLEALAASDFKAMLRFNAQFHFRIYRRAGRPVHLRFVEALWLRIGPTLRHMYPTLQIERSGHRGHENIIESAQARDAFALRAAVIADLDTSETALYRHIAQAAEGRRRRKLVTP